MSLETDLATVRTALQKGHYLRSDGNDATFGNALEALDRLEQAGREAVNIAGRRGVNLGSMLAASNPTLGFF